MLTAVDDLPGHASIADFRAGLLEWMAANEATLRPFRSDSAVIADEVFPLEVAFRRLLAEGGWAFYGWPTAAGGRGGSAAWRAVLYDELAAAGYRVPDAFVMLEVLGQVLCDYSPAIAHEELGPFLRGERLWCQGFSEPDAGSDLASLRTRAVARDDGFVVNGQKVWVSFAPHAERCALLVRTGPADSRHRGLSLLWVDLSSPGVTVRPIRTATSREEFAEIFFDDVVVPRTSLIGDVNQGWAVTLHLLQYERGMYGWLRQAWLHRRLEEAICSRPAGADLSIAGEVGGAYLAVLSHRLRCRRTVLRLAAAEFVGPETSVDKVLLSTADQEVLDAARNLLWPAFADADTADADQWRADWFYTRASSIYGGSVDTQRDIIAEHLLKLPRSH